jgi:N-acetylmuramoyl-L-alanine amidase
MLILHYTGMQSAEAAIDWLCRAESGVSCHYAIDERGRITQMVSEAERAWHAGVAFWQGERDINSASIGIEIQNPGHELGYVDFPDAQMQAVIELCQDVRARHDIRPDRVLAHSDVAPARKVDPGEKFDWAALAAHGIGKWVEPAALREGPTYAQGSMGPPVQALQSFYDALGFEITVNGVFDAATETVTRAFQRHWRQARVDGVADASTLETLHRLLTC